MDGSGERFMWLCDRNILEIPFFQRPYVWNAEQFDSLVDSFDAAPNNTMPFFGSIILKQIGEEDKGHYLVIDGQQRITTFSILIRALLDVNDKHNFLKSDEMKRCLNKCIYRISTDNEGYDYYIPKLVSSNSDKTIYDKILDQNEDRKNLKEILDDSPLSNAYKYFLDYFERNVQGRIPLDFSLKLNSQNKSLIFIILDDKDDEQKIFDSVNSLGKTLSNSDIIKNYLFQKMKEFALGDSVKEKTVMEIYNKYWDKIFYDNDMKDFWYTEVTNGRLKMDYLECFLKEFAIIKKIYFAKTTTGTYGLCNAYKRYIDDFANKENSLTSIIEFVKELNEYAKAYYKYKKEYIELNSYVWDDYKNRLLMILDVMDTNTFNPYVLKLLKENPDDIEKRFFNLEKFLLLRFIYEGTTKNYNQCCEGLLNATDDEMFFKKYLEDSPVSNDNYKIKFRKLTNSQGVMFLFLIEMLYRRGEEEKYSDLLNIDKYTLEHIMPQKWATNVEWMKVDSYDEAGNLIDKNNVDLFTNTRKAAVKSIGNFALLTSKLNTSISNSSFEIKINGNGKKSGIRQYATSLKTTASIIEKYDNGAMWNEREIYEKEEEYYNALNSYYQFSLSVKENTMLEEDENQVSYENLNSTEKFYIKNIGKPGRQTDASCIVKDGKFIVLKGSLIAKTPTQSCPSSISNMRKKYGRLIDSNGKLIEDISFKSPTGAARLVLYASTNGKRDWKSEDGTSMGEKLNL